MSEPLHVGVEFEAPGDPIMGRLLVNGDRRRFTGWLGLISGLQRALDDRNAPGSVGVGNGEHHA